MAPNVSMNDRFYMVLGMGIARVAKRCIPNSFLGLSESSFSYLGALGGLTHWTRLGIWAPDPTKFVIWESSHATTHGSFLFKQKRVSFVKGTTGYRQGTDSVPTTGRTRSGYMTGRVPTEVPTEYLSRYRKSTERGSGSVPTEYRVSSNGQSNHSCSTGLSDFLCSKT